MMMDEVVSVMRKRKNTEESDLSVFGSNSKSKSLNLKKLKSATKAEREEEARLEKLVFGESSLVSRASGQLHHEDVDDSDSGLEEGDEPDEGAMGIVTAAAEDKIGRSSGVKRTLQAAWEDDEDMPARGATGSGSSVAWARLSHSTAPLCDASSDSDDENSANSDDHDGDDDLLRHCGDLLQAKKAVAMVHCGSRSASLLPSGVLHFRKTKALNRCTHVEGPLVTNVQFHPTSTVAAVAGVSGVASIVEVDGRNNAKLASIQFERFPIHCARFSSDGTELLVGSRSHPHFFAYDLLGGRTTKVQINRALGITNAKNFEVSPDGEHIALAGRWGAVHILSARAKEWITTLQVTGEVSCMKFSSDGSHLYTYGEGGQVWVWSMALRSCTHRFEDEGSLGGTSLAVSPCSRFIACGCSSGHVSVYNQEEALKLAIDGVCRPAPVCTISNLVTPVTTLKFDPSSELLLMASSDKADAARMFHVPSRTVFSNFPGRAPHMQRPLCADISPHGGFLSIGSSKGTALLYRLSHFGSY